MLTQEENERFTRVGSGTPAGNLFRRYWQPIAPKQQLVEKRVMPIRLFGEDLVLYLDGKGRMGLVGDRCPHRLVKLECGYTSELGLKCAYHGWTYDAEGHCVDQPAEPPGSTYKDKIAIKAYPVEEVAGLIFAYLGPKDQPAPAVPRWDRLMWNNCYRVITYTVIPCNWLQCAENSPDMTHGMLLHGDYALDRLRTLGIQDGDPRIGLAKGFQRLITRHEYGAHKYGLSRAWLSVGQDEAASTWSNYTPFIFPNTHVTSGSGRHDCGWRVPLDDTHTMQVFMKVFQPPKGVVVPPQPFVPYCELPMAESFDSGTLDTIHGQDWMVWEMQGEIMDRTQEHLGDADRGLIVYRQILREQLNIVEAGGEPMNVFHDTEQIDLPMPWDGTYTWAFDKDGKYQRGALTGVDHLPHEIAEEIEDIFERALANQPL